MIIWLKASISKLEIKIQLPFQTQTQMIYFNLKFQLEGGDKSQKFELSFLHLGYCSLRYLMTGNTCGFVFPLKKTPTKLKLLFHINGIKIAIFTVYVQNIWLYVRANNFMYCSSNRLESCRDTIDYQLHI